MCITVGAWSTFTVAECKETAHLDFKCPPPETPHCMQSFCNHLARQPIIVHILLCAASLVCIFKVYRGGATCVQGVILWPFCSHPLDPHPPRFPPRSSSTKSPSQSWPRRRWRSQCGTTTWESLMTLSVSGRHTNTPAANHFPAGAFRDYWLAHWLVH